LYSFDDMLQNVSDAISFCREKYNDNIAVLGSSQGGILCIAAAGKDHRIKAVFPHNILLPALKNTIFITSFPGFFKHFYSLIPKVMKLGARLFPLKQIPVTFYLDTDRIFSSKESTDIFFHDPLNLNSYPLYFLSSLFSAKLDSITDGSIQCPVVVIASSGDRLFSFDYCQEVYNIVKAPFKEMLVFDEPHHFILNESVDIVSDPIIKKLNKYLR